MHEQFIKFCSVKATAARSVDFLHGGVGRETAFGGGDADYGAICAVEVIDVEASKAGEFVVDENEGGEEGVPWSGEFGERRGEVGVEVVSDEANGNKVDEKHDGIDRSGQPILRGREKRMKLSIDMVMT